jgi:hypothetical protein
MIIFTIVIVLQPFFEPLSLRCQFLYPIHNCYDSLDGGSAHSDVSTYNMITQTHSKHKQILSMSPKEFDPTIPVLEWVKTVEAVDSAAAVWHRDSFTSPVRTRQD